MNLSVKTSSNPSYKTPPFLFSKKGREAYRKKKIAGKGKSSAQCNGSGSDLEAGSGNRLSATT